jgi:hypothetical protein
LRRFKSTGEKPPYPTKQDSRKESNSSGKWQKGVKDDSSSRLDASVNAVTKPTISVALEPGTPSISVRIEGVVRDLIVDTGSNISILQPGILKSEFKFTDSRLYGVTGETLDVKGRQTVSFVLGGRKFNHQFLVCSLPTEAAGLIGMDFLKESGAIVNFEWNKMSLTDIGKAPRAEGTTLNKGTAFTIFLEGKEGHSPQPTRLEAQHMDKQVPADSPHERTSSPARENITMAPRSQQVVIGKVEFEKAKEPQNANLSQKPKREKNPDPLSRDSVQHEQSRDAFCQKQKPGNYRNRSEFFQDKDDVMYRRQRNGKHQLVLQTLVQEPQP